MVSWEKAELRFGSEMNFQASRDGELHDTNKLLIAAFFFFLTAKVRTRDCCDKKHREILGTGQAFGGTIGWKVKEKVKENGRS